MLRSYFRLAVRARHDLDGLWAGCHLPPWGYRDLSVDRRRPADRVAFRSRNRLARRVL